MSARLAGADAATSGETQLLSGQAPAPTPMRCCCGSLECVYLQHNCSVLETVEKDVHQAARMGQALLARHEAYMADAERDRGELTSRIGQLEMDNKELEARNAKTVEENRSLLDQLEALNSCTVDSEGRIKSLEATLLSSQQTIRRLENETARAAALERQLILLEQEQEDLQNNLTMSREEARSAMSRWQRAERGINDLQEQLERMEKETKEERDHHLEMMGRIEKQREMEKELNTAAGRLKAAAAAKALNQAKEGGNVVSHFVRDLLQDNANLQHSIAELREMLFNSHDEIQALREQVLYHQPLEENTEVAPTLRSELGSEHTSPQKEHAPSISQELHIHHHYHVQKPEVKKPKKKRQGLTQGTFAPPTSSPYPSTPPTHGAGRPHMSHAHKDSRWSVFSEQPSELALSSVPSSPTSNHRNSLFDPIMDSFPTSPTTSIDPLSPTWRASHRKQPSNMSARSFQLPTNFSLANPTPRKAQPIIEETDDLEGIPESLGATDESTDQTDVSVNAPDTPDDQSLLFSDPDEGQPARRLRRALSHESIISLTGGLDIHTLRNRPSQLTLRHLGSANTVTASSTVTAKPMLSRQPKRSSTMLRDRYGASPADSLRSVSSPTPQTGSSKLGSWMGWRPWGGSGSASNSDTSSVRTVVDKDSKSLLGRSPGINQAGAIPGFAQYLAASQRRVPPSKVLPDILDAEALQEGLSE